MRIEDSVAFVTGANRGIGKAFVDALLARGARRVYAASRTRLAVEHAKDPRVVHLALDVTRPEEVAAAAAAAPDVTLLVNNAGVASFANALENPLEKVRLEMETNYFGPLNLIRELAPVLERNRPAAVANVLSVVSLAAMPALGSYSASKAAAASLTQAIRPLLAGKGISVHGVLPGPVDTDMARSFPIEKTSAAAVAEAALDGIESGDEDITPDPMSRDARAFWSTDPKGLEVRFGAM